MGQENFAPAGETLTCAKQWRLRRVQGQCQDQWQLPRASKPAEIRGFGTLFLLLCKTTDARPMSMLSHEFAFIAMKCIHALPSFNCANQSWLARRLEIYGPECRSRRDRLRSKTFAGARYRSSVSLKKINTLTESTPSQPTNQQDRCLWYDPISVRVQSRHPLRWNR